MIEINKSWKPLKYGNSKLHHDLTWSLPAVRSCPRCKKFGCDRECYGLHGNYTFKNVKDSLELNFRLARFELDRLEDLINKQLGHTKHPWSVRIHCTGEFFNQRYLDMWTRVAQKNSNHQFFFFTKEAGRLDFSKFIALSNVSAVNSVLPTGTLNFGNPEWLRRTKHDLDRLGCEYFVCPYPKADKNEDNCGTKCTYCRDCTGKFKTVLFLKH